LGLGLPRGIYALVASFPGHDGKLLLVLTRQPAHPLVRPGVLETSFEPLWTRIKGGLGSSSIYVHIISRVALNDKLPPLYVPPITLELGLAPSHWTPPGVLWTGRLASGGPTSRHNSRFLRKSSISEDFCRFFCRNRSYGRFEGCIVISASRDAFCVRNF